MLRDIVDDLVRGTKDVEVAADVPVAGAAAALRCTRADFVITGRNDQQLVSELLAQRPAVNVLVVTDSGRTGVLHRLVPERTRLDDLSAERLLEIVRAAVHVA